MTLSPYQEAPSPPVTDEIAEKASIYLHVVEPGGQIYLGHNAILRIYEILGWRWSVWFFRLPPIRWVTPHAYLFLANNRRWFSKVIFRTPE